MTKFSNIVGKFALQLLGYLISVINFQYIGKFGHVTTSLCQGLCPPHASQQRGPGNEVAPYLTLLITSPYLTLTLPHPHLTSPSPHPYLTNHLTSPYLTLPHPHLTYLTLPYLTPPHLILPPKKHHVYF